MPGNYSHTSRTDGTVLTDAIYNGDHENHVNNSTPDGIDDASVDVSAFRAVSDPGETGTENLPTSLRGELQRLRKMIAEVVGKAQWYESPANSVEALHGSVQTLLSDMTEAKLVAETAQLAADGGSTVEFLEIPPWAKRVTILLDRVSLAEETAIMGVQVGTSSGFVTTGYRYGVGFIAGTDNSGTSFTSSGPQFDLTVGEVASLSDDTTGTVVLTKISGNTWIVSGRVSVFNSFLNDTAIESVDGNIALAEALDRVRLRVAAPSVFDAGTVNILYE